MTSTTTHNPQAGLPNGGSAKELLIRLHCVNECVCVCYVCATFTCAFTQSPTHSLTNAPTLLPSYSFIFSYAKKRAAGIVPSPAGHDSLLDSPSTPAW